MPDPPPSDSDVTPAAETAPHSRLRRWLRWPLRAALLAVALVLGYLAASEVGTRVAVNRGARPLEGEVDVYLVSNGVHVDVWVPAQRPERDWTLWFADSVAVPRSGYVAFGWGDRGFYLDTPTWDDLTLSTALRALAVPSRSAMHVTPYFGRPIEHDDVHLLRVTPAAYARLVEFLESGFALDPDGRPALIDHPGYFDGDRFFEGRGAYHLFDTCNVWTNDAVKAMGKTAALWAPFERGARFHLPRNRGR